MFRKIVIFGIIIVFLIGIIEISGHILYRAAKGVFVWQLYKQNNVFNVRPFTELVQDERLVTNKKNFSCIITKSNIYSHSAVVRNDDKWLVETDVFGFRKGLNKYFKDKKNIVFIGDSVPFGWGINSGKSIPSQLFDMLQKGAITQYGIINAAVPSYSLNQAISRYKYEIDGKFPVSCVLLQIIDPAPQFVMWGRQWNKGSCWTSRDSVNYSNEAVNNYLRKQNNLYGFLDKYSFIFHAVYVARQRLNKGDRMPLLLKQEDVAAFEFFRAENIKLLEDFYSLLQEKEVPLVIISINLRDTLSGLSLSELEKLEPRTKLLLIVVERFNKIMRAFAEKHKNVYFLDLVSLFARENRKPLFLKDGLHLTDKGANKEARFILELLQKNNIL